MLTSLASLWLPILASGIALFFASWAFHMVFPHHKGEWMRLPDENATMRELASDKIPPGQYCFPYPSCPKDMQSESFKAKMQAGPCGNLTISKSAPNMGLNMLCTVVFFLIANAVIAYLAGMVLPPVSQPDDRWKIFRFVGTAGILTYGTANILNGIWFSRKMIADIVDGIAYGLLTGAIFAALWPAALV
jgi:hypothetical protein